VKVTDAMVERAYKAFLGAVEGGYRLAVRIALEAVLADIPEPSAPRRFTEAERSALQAAMCCVYADKKTDYICPTTSPCNCRVYTALLNEFSDPPAPPKCKNCKKPIRKTLFSGRWVHDKTNAEFCASLAEPEDAP
jgi:hypothetical protein